MDTSVQDLIANSKRRVGAIPAGLMALVETLTARCHARGVHVVFTQGLRTFAEQAALYGQGRSSYIWNGKQYARPGKIVTNARPGSSIHNYGLALDFAIVKNGTQIIWDTTADLDRDGKADWMEVVEEAKRLGFTWGGDWKSFRDFPHIEWLGGLSYAQVFAGKKPVFPKITQVSKPETPKAESKFYQESDKLKEVVTLKAVNVYSDLDFKKPLADKKIKKGMKVKITGVKKTKGGTPRLVTKDGFISANKLYVMDVKVAPSTFYVEKDDVKEIKTLKDVNVYCDVEFKKPIADRKIKKGTTVKILGMTKTKNGVPRFITEGGYVSTNKLYVKDVKEVKASATTSYTIKKGDTLTTIAKAHKTTVAKLKSLNGLKNDNIVAGKKLKVPKTEAPKTTSYKIKAGDTLGKIAKAYGTTVAKLKSLNGLKNDTIVAGKSLKVPAK